MVIHRLCVLRCHAKSQHHRSLQFRSPLFSDGVYSSPLKGTDYPHVATNLNNLAGLYRSQGRYADAEPLYLRALAILFDRLGETHPNTQTVIENFLYFVQQVIQAGQTAQLSEHPLTRGAIEQMQQQTE
ncbi:MAG: tetratricopeptide repeat protein [Cyanobacteria bacterium CRU_2_1]|nr:tetratricopeptide repeat protein [Cyanobacteria bacterium RU_5_0]NJR57897.1 tetratricopeptide repeat protein [Cyanobacteria bacterium CRU_2_1]